MDIISFTKVSLPFGWLGNMSPYSIIYENIAYKTVEALFQCLRFKDENIKQLICEQKSPMGAKMVAKANKNLMIVEPLSQKDIDNMNLCISLKLEQHPKLKILLLETGSKIIYEDVTARGDRGSNLFWGALYQNGQWIGRNELGKIWMNKREELKS